LLQPHEMLYETCYHPWNFYNSQTVTSFWKTFVKLHKRQSMQINTEKEEQLMRNKLCSKNKTFNYLVCSLPCECEKILM
jgi:hypothetical protein